MLVETLAAAAVGLLVVWVVLQPLLGAKRREAQRYEPIDPEETPKGIALTALKEIEFDRETGKLSDSDYDLLKNKYTAVALEALRQEAVDGASDDVEAMVAARVRALRFASATTSSNAASPEPGPAPACLTCGPRPEPDASFCSSCGSRLPTGAVCDRCGAVLSRESRFCEGCGHRVAA
jgi:rRNA maturation endonuclease Nob1